MPWIISLASGKRLCAASASVACAVFAMAGAKVGRAEIEVSPSVAMSPPSTVVHSAHILTERLPHERASVSSPAPAVLGGADDSAAVASVVARFHAALAAGDSAAALELLAPDAVILESGGIETREEYRSHHLPADIAFARAVKSVRSSVQVTVQGNAAWAASTSTTEGEFRGRPVNSSGAELMVLVRRGDSWRITAVHWSSRTRRS